VLANRPDIVREDYMNELTVLQVRSKMGLWVWGWLAGWLAGWLVRLLGLRDVLAFGLLRWTATEAAPLRNPKTRQALTP